MQTLHLEASNVALWKSEVLISRSAQKCKLSISKGRGLVPGWGYLALTFGTRSAQGASQ